MGKKKKLNNEGFSLIEILVSFTILVLVMISLMNYFITAIKANAVASQIQQGTDFAQTIMEKSKDMNMNEVKDLFPSELESEIKDALTGKIECKFSDVERNGRKYNVLVTVNPKSSTEYETLNNTEVVELAGISYPESIAATETIQDQLAFNYFQARNDFAASLVAGDKRTDEEIKQSTHKVVYVSMNQFSGNTVSLQVYYKYYAVGIPGVTNNSEATAKNFNRDVYSKNIDITKLEKLYLFYKKPMTSTGKMKLYLSIDLATKTLLEGRTEKIFGLYLVGQDNASAPTTHVTVSQTDSILMAAKFNYYHNGVNFTFTNGVGTRVTDVIEKGEINKISNLEVKIFEAGSYSSDKMITKLESTKGE